MPQKQHVIHGRDHCPGGADPIPCLPNAGGETTYPDIVQAHPCLVHYWPCDEAFGDLIDRVGSWDLVRDTADVGGTDYPLYGAAGPLTELPELTAVVNAGTSGAFGSDGRFAHTFGSAPSFWTGAAEFAVEFWTYLTAYGSGSGTSVFFEATGGGGGGAALTIDLFSAIGSPKGLSVTRGPVTVTDPDDMPLNTWQHVVGSFDGSTLSLYRNGALVGSSAGGALTLDDRMAWLNKTAASWFPANARGAQLAIYDCALTDEEIAEHLAAQDASPNAPAGHVLTADGEGSFSFMAPTIEVEY